MFAIADYQLFITSETRNPYLILALYAIGSKKVLLASLAKL
jgi:hypothetical protein